MLLERIPYIMVLLRLFGIPRISTLYTCPPHMESFQTFYYWTHFNGCRCCIDHLLILCASYTRRTPYHSRAGNRMVILHNQLCASHSGYVPDVHMYNYTEGTTNHNRIIKTQLWHVSYAHILARSVGNSIQADFGIAYRFRYSLYCSKHIYQLFRNCKNYFIHTGQ